MRKQEINYTLRYKQFNFSASTHKPDVVGLIMQAKKSLANYNMSFLTNNYNQMRALEPIYSFGPLVSEKIENLKSR